ncbi:hypothetical protein [Lederbergia galactosidilytica]|uniref:Uncharacterized protein n=1 Tax=Lederbergia galactosidilytica TaxID=217031 RepID=A0A0Q9YCX0_9BACI|nr:hypothetical protein [Lederbergia galactosidilytica]KRG14964.1 hypothetical protein ACA29_05410 [Lederbergia galactosidilytica]KRG15583.1 hypothetical protein ACA30_05675 [Virgibacillus soli]MBP1914785.1 hypothetical protein [Lederbergia galactosidilytica]OAK74684.1 hypothetical protein ABB05_03720 [Lederbergia galactosidilytica]
MNTLIIILFSLSILLLLISLFQPDRTKGLEKELEQVSMKLLQENYLLKKRVKVLEEELLVTDLSESLPLKEPINKPNEILKNQVIALYHQGLDLGQISRQSSLSIDKVQQIIASYESNLGGDYRG